MNTIQLLTQTGFTFIAASLGAIIGAFLTRRIERFKHLQELRSTAYADFLRGFARVGRAQADGNKDARSRLEELDGRITVTDARSRIAIYGSTTVIRAFAKFVEHGTQTIEPDGMRAFAELCSLMRAEATKGGTPPEDIERVLFG